MHFRHALQEPTQRALEELVRRSKALSQVRGSQLFSSVKHLEEASAMEETVRALWRVMHEDERVVAAIETAVHQALCHVHDAATHNTVIRGD